MFSRQPCQIVNNASLSKNAKKLHSSPMSIKMATSHVPWVSCFTIKNGNACMHVNHPNEDKHKMVKGWSDCANKILH